jgi:hypothetical protein
MPSNTLLTPSLITNDTLMILVNNLVMAGKVNRQFENQFVKIGTTLTVRKPNRFLVTSGPGLQIQNITEPSTSITINSQQHIDFLFSSVDLTLVIEEFSERYLKPAAEKLANKVDMDVMANYSQVSNIVGTPGSTPNSFQSLAAVGQRMDEGAVPQDGRTLVLNAAATWGVAGALINTYVRSVAEPAYKGYLAAIANMEIYLDQNVQRQTVGAIGTTFGASGPRTTTAGQTGSNINVDQMPSSVTNALLAGDVITFQGVNGVNPESLQDTGALKNFVVTANVTSTGTTATIPISPAIVSSGAFQNVTAAPIAHAQLAVLDGTQNISYPQNLAFVRDAFGLVTVPMELPDGVDFKAREQFKNISMRIIRQYDINNDWTPCRMDVLYGTATFYEELAVRLSG